MCVIHSSKQCSFPRSGRKEKGKIFTVLNFALAKLPIFYFAESKNNIYRLKTSRFPLFFLADRREKHPFSRSRNNLLDLIMLSVIIFFNKYSKPFLPLFFGLVLWFFVCVCIPMGQERRKREFCTFFFFTCLYLNTDTNKDLCFSSLSGLFC